MGSSRHPDFLLQHILVMAFVELEIDDRVVYPEACERLEVMHQYAQIPGPLTPRSIALPGQETVCLDASCPMVVADDDDATNIPLVRKPQFVFHKEPVWMMSDVEAPPTFGGSV